MALFDLKKLHETVCTNIALKLLFIHIVFAPCGLENRVTTEM